MTKKSTLLNRLSIELKARCPNSLKKIKPTNQDYDIEYPSQFLKPLQDNTSPLLFLSLISYQQTLTNGVWHFPSGPPRPIQTLIEYTHQWDKDEFILKSKIAININQEENPTDE